MKKQLELLFYNYYKFQIYVGNSGMASFYAILSIILIFIIYFFAFFFIIIFLIPKHLLIINESGLFTFIYSFIILISIYLYFNLIYKGKYKIIVEKFNNDNGKDTKLFAILLPIVGFVILIIGCILKILQNQGKL